MTRFSEFFSSFRNAYTQRGIFMVLRESEDSNEIFVQNPKTKKMECVLSYPRSSGQINIGCMGGFWVSCS